ncbi:MAG: hypothetical protein F4142_11790 [Nitrospira sp. SB0675_bin_23]|nr:hypothetical protein [Nitrospira sp. SB0675_bin_23]
MTPVQTEGYAPCVSRPPSTPAAEPAAPQNPAQLRRFLQESKSADPDAWESARKLVHRSRLEHTLARLVERIQHSPLPGTLRDGLVAGLRSASAEGTDRVRLKELTGLPPTKAIRALCVHFAIVREEASSSGPPPHEVEAFVKQDVSPYDLLLQVEKPSLLDLGAGDLSFEEGLLDQYLTSLQQSGKALTLHAVDRLQPGSQLGGAYHANPERLRRLTRDAPDTLQFRFWGGVDMMDLSTHPHLLARYTVLTCHAPATPTFAYEPTRLSPATIHSHLTKTKGEYRTVRVRGEKALEVMHRGQALTFPHWKFVIHGPLALLDLAVRRGALCILSAIDDEVFWEILAQLVEDPGMRPQDVVFTPNVLPEIFGHVHQALTSVKIGERCNLSDVTPLRQNLLGSTTPQERKPPTWSFRFVEIRRGAVFPGMPAGSTARQFRHMSEEVPPWHLVLVPERVPSR